MTRRYTTILAGTALCGMVTAQTSLDPTEHLPVLGNDFLMHVGPYVQALPPGEGVLFDHSGITPTGQVTGRWRSPSEYSDPAEQPDATLMFTREDGDTLFYRTSGEGLERVGERRDLLGQFDVKVAYTDGPLEVKMPLEFGAAWTDAILANFDVDGTAGTRNGSINGIADAYGTVRIPGGFEGQALRVRTVLTETIAVGFVQLDHRRHEHLYYVPLVNAPIMRMVTDTLEATSPFPLTQVISFTEWLDESLLSVDAVEADPFGLQVFPNPASDRVEVVFRGLGAMAGIELVDLTGAVHHREPLGNVMVGEQRRVLDVSRLASGLYLLRIMAADGTQSTQRLMVGR